MNKILSALVFSLAVAIAPQFARAAGLITVEGAWSRPVPTGLPTAVVYLTLHNSGGIADRLVGASAPVAESATLHRSAMDKGMMTMAPVPGGLAIPAHGAAILAPNGYHLMLEGLKQGLAVGARFPLTLTFQHAGPMRVEVEVRAAAPKGSTAGMKM
jgi:copper(I)-binding protein